MPVRVNLIDADIKLLTVTLTRACGKCIIIKTDDIILPTIIIFDIIKKT